jgi:integrase/recombinase XerD
MHQIAVGTKYGIGSDVKRKKANDKTCRIRSFSGVKSTSYYFEGQFPGTSISTRTAKAVFNQVYKSLGLPKGITFHSLRHSYAIHLVENGIDVTFVQHMLGHNDVRTTLRYTHVSQKKINQIESPLDRALRLKNEKENEK